MKTDNELLVQLRAAAARGVSPAELREQREVVAHIRKTEGGDELQWADEAGEGRPGQLIPLYTAPPVPAVPDEEWGDLFAEVRDNILHGRGHLDGVLDNEQTNAVLGEIDRLDVPRLALTVPNDIALDAAKYRELNTPEIADFLVAIEREALHQRERHGADHDAGKSDFDWVFLLGHLATRSAMYAKAGNLDKALHHIITSAAVCLNWHAAKVGAHTGMRPGTAGDAP